MAAETTCYRQAFGNIAPVSYTPCGTSEPGFYNSESGFQLCCGDNACGSNSICKWSTNESHIAGGSGYFLGGYTDPSFRDPVCNGLCNNNGNNVIYREDLGIWSCCSFLSDGYTPNCSQPVNGSSFELSWTPSQFPGPVNERASAAASTSIASTIVASATSSLSTSAISTSATSSAASSTVSAASQAPSAGSGGLSTGAKAGIGVGAALGGLLLVGLIAAVVILWRRQSRSSGAPSEARYQKEMEPNGKPYAEASAARSSIYRSPQYYEADAMRSPVEMNGQGRVSELHGSSEPMYTRT